MCKENKTAQIRSPCLPNRQVLCPYTCPEFWRIDEPSLQEMYWAGIFGHVDGIIVMKRTWGIFGYVIKGGNTIRPFTVSKTFRFLTTKCPYLNTLGQWQRRLPNTPQDFFSIVRYPSNPEIPVILGKVWQGSSTRNTIKIFFQNSGKKQIKI